VVEEEKLSGEIEEKEKEDEKKKGDAKLKTARQGRSQSPSVKDPPKAANRDSELREKGRKLGEKPAVPEKSWA